MKIRNLPYKELNETEQRIVTAFWKEQVKDDTLCGREYLCNENVESFWEEHREQDTQNGEYDGWKL